MSRFFLFFKNLHNSSSFGIRHSAFGIRENFCVNCCIEEEEEEEEEQEEF